MAGVDGLTQGDGRIDDDVGWRVGPGRRRRVFRRHGRFGDRDVAFVGGRGGERGHGHPDGVGSAGGEAAEIVPHQGAGSPGVGRNRGGLEVEQVGVPSVLERDGDEIDVAVVEDREVEDEGFADRRRAVERGDEGLAQREARIADFVGRVVGQGRDRRDLRRGGRRGHGGVQLRCGGAGQGAHGDRDPVAGAGHEATEVVPGQFAGVRPVRPDRGPHEGKVPGVPGVSERHGGEIGVAVVEDRDIEDQVLADGGGAAQRRDHRLAEREARIDDLVGRLVGLRRDRRLLRGNGRRGDGGVGLLAGGRVERPHGDGDRVCLPGSETAQVGPSEAAGRNPVWLNRCVQIAEVVGVPLVLERHGHQIDVAAVVDAEFEDDLLADGGGAAAGRHDGLAEHVGGIVDRVGRVVGPRRDGRVLRRRGGRGDRDIAFGVGDRDGGHGHGDPVGGAGGEAAEVVPAEFAGGGGIGGDAGGLVPQEPRVPGVAERDGLEIDVAGVADRDVEDDSLAERGGAGLGRDDALLESVARIALLDFGRVVVRDRIDSIRHAVGVGRVAGDIGEVDEVAVDDGVEVHPGGFAGGEQADVADEVGGDVGVAQGDVAEVGLAGVGDVEAVGHGAAGQAADQLDAGAGLSAVVARVDRLEQLDGGNRLVEAAVEAVVAFAAGEERRERGGGRIAVALVVPGVAPGRHHAAGRAETDRVATGRKTREQVAPDLVGDGLSDAVAVLVQQFDGHAGDAGLVPVLESVAVEVVPHAVSHFDREDIAAVQREVGGAGGQEVGERRRIRVAVRRVVARVLRRAKHAEGIEDRHRVPARREAIEAVPAIRVGVGDREEPAPFVEEQHRDIHDARFTVVLDAVGVPVLPHEVANRDRPVETAVEAEVLLAGGEEGRERGAGRIAVDGVVADVHRRGHHAVRSLEGHTVLPRAQSIEQVAAIRVGERRGDRVAVGVVQGHRDALDAGLAELLDAVGVEVLPHEVADPHRAHVAAVEAEVLLPGGEEGGGRGSDSGRCPARRRPRQSGSAAGRPDRRRTPSRRRGSVHQTGSGRCRRSAGWRWRRRSRRAGRRSGRGRPVRLRPGYRRRSCRATQGRRRGRAGTARRRG